MISEEILIILSAGLLLIITFLILLFPVILILSILKIIKKIKSKQRRTVFIPKITRFKKYSNSQIIFWFSIICLFMFLSPLLIELIKDIFSGITILNIPLIIIFLISFPLALKAKHKAQEMDFTLTSNIRGLAMGNIEIKGKPFPIETKALISPITNTKCVAYAYTISEKKNKQKKHDEYTNLHHEQKLNNFYLKDSTGKVLINPDNAQIFTKLSYNKIFEKKSKLPENLINLLKELNLDLRYNSKNFNNLKIEETTIPIEKEIYIYGHAEKNKNIEIGTAQTNTENIIITSSKNNSIFMIISDKKEENLRQYFNKIKNILYITSILSFFIITLLFLIRFNLF